jgi:hypothetical protein
MRFGIRWYGLCRGRATLFDTGGMCIGERIELRNFKRQPNSFFEIQNPNVYRVDFECLTVFLGFPSCIRAKQAWN